MLREVAHLDPPRFMRLLDRFDSPYPVWAAIEGTRARRHLAAWRDLVAVAPRAFSPDGSWAGSVILPLLLVVAAQAVAQGGAPYRRHETPAEAEAAGTAVRQAAEQVADILLSRSDGAPAALRWGARLTRDLTIAPAEGPPVPADARDRAFAPWQLVAALAQRAGPDAWRSLSPGDMPDEEEWFSLMAKAIAVPQSPTSARDFANLLAAFTDAWPNHDDPEAWQDARGVRLRALSAIVRSPVRQPSALGVRLLAIPLTMNPDPVAVWVGLWRRCAILREVVEFAELTLSVTSDDDRPWAPGELCWLIMNLGLCAVDQIADERIELPYERGTALAALLPELWDGVAEMLAIDRFGRETWDRARRHLILRRMLFAADRASGSGPRVIPADTRPSLATMLREMATVERPFFSILTNLLDVGVEVETLRMAIVEAAIDLPSLIDAASRVNAADERRSAASEQELQRLREI